MHSFLDIWLIIVKQTTTFCDTRFYYLQDDTQIATKHQCLETFPKCTLNFNQITQHDHGMIKIVFLKPKLTLFKLKNVLHFAFYWPINFEAKSIFCYFFILFHFFYSFQLLDTCTHILILSAFLHICVSRLKS